MDQRPKLLWYHDHRMDFTGPALWRGLAGLHIVRDDSEDELGLPAGTRELPLMITDRSFAADGSLHYPALDPTLRGQPGVQERYLAGVLGDVILVNGAPWPFHEVDAARYRLRMLNASNARHYELEAITDDSRIPATLSTDLRTWQRSDAVHVRDIAFRVGQMHSGHGWLIDGLSFDPSRSDVTVGLDDIEVWRLIADVHHPVHLHLVGFRVLSRGGRPPLPYDAGLKDTVALRPGEAVEIITRFDGYRGRYLFHCHNAEHEDMGMMANLEIT